MRRGDKAWTIVDDPKGQGRGFILKEWRMLRVVTHGVVLTAPTLDGAGPEIKYFPRSMVLDAQQAEEFRREAAEAEPRSGDLVLVIEQFKHKPLQGIVVSTTKAMADVLMTDGSTGPAWKPRREDGNPLRRCSKRTLVVIERSDAAADAA
jgi:hypothetical protein